MAPLIHIEDQPSRAVLADQFIALEAAQSSVQPVLAVVVIILVSVLILSTVVICICCGNDLKKKMQEEADAAVPPPPTGTDSERSLTSKKGFSFPSTSPSKKGQSPTPLKPIPRHEAHDFKTMALADSAVFDKPKSTKKGQTCGKLKQTPKANMDHLPEGLGTIALADSKVFDKK